MGRYTYLLLPFVIFGAILAILYVIQFVTDAIALLQYWKD